MSNCILGVITFLVGCVVFPWLFVIFVSIFSKFKN